MAQFVLTNKMVLLGVAWTGTAPGAPGTQTPAGTITTPLDVSGFLTQADHGVSAAMKDNTNFGSGGYKSVLPGITEGDDIVLQAFGDYAAAQLYANVITLGGIARPGSSPIYTDIKPTNSARGATNPSFVGAVWLSSWKPCTGSVGDIAGMQLTLGVTGKFADLTA